MASLPRTWPTKLTKEKSVCSASASTRRQRPFQTLRTVLCAKTSTPRSSRCGNCPLIATARTTTWIPVSSTSKIVLRSTIWSCPFLTKYTRRRSVSTIISFLMAIAEVWQQLASYLTQLWLTGCSSITVASRGISLQ